MPFLRNAWYCAGWAHQLGREPIARTLLNEPVLLYRKEDGRAVALGNRCPHRFAPLHRGKLIGDVIQCPYHGLQFDSTGVCVHNPHGDGKIPKSAQVKRYPLEERHAVLWIWMGDEACADIANIPDFSPLNDPKHYTVVYGYLHIPAHYELMNDNLLDLSHVRYLHPFLSGGQEAMSSATEARFKMRQEGNTVIANNVLINAPLSPIYKLLWQPVDAPLEMRANMRWDPPGNLFLDTGMTYVGKPASDGPAIPTAHLLTPETDTSTHYYFATARDCKLEDEGLSEALHVGTSNAFANEDEPMIGWCRDNMGTNDLDSLNPVLLVGDAAAVRARRVLKGLIAAEATTETNSPEKIASR